MGINTKDIWPCVSEPLLYNSDTVKIIPMGVTTMGEIPLESDILLLIGHIAGECYNSSMDSDKCIRRALQCIDRGHHSPWEHLNITFKCTVDRGVSHALVRHRHCAFQQSSTIYQNFKDGIAVIDMPYWDVSTGKALRIFNIQDIQNFEHCYETYRHCIDNGCAPSEARDHLPTCLATNLIITTNIRQWMYMLHRRVGPGDSARMHMWAHLIREVFEDKYPQITKAFDSWYKTHPL